MAIGYIRTQEGIPFEGYHQLWEKGGLFPFNSDKVPYKLPSESTSPQVNLEYIRHLAYHPMQYHCRMLILNQLFVTMVQIYWVIDAVNTFHGKIPSDKIIIATD